MIQHLLLRGMDGSLSSRDHRPTAPGRHAVAQQGTAFGPDRKAQHGHITGGNGLVKKFDMFYYYVCTTQYITDTKQIKKQEKGHN